jgi:hypothetical protein
MIQFLFLLVNFFFFINKTQQINITVPLPSEKNNQQRNLCYISNNTTRCSNWAGSQTWIPLEVFIPKNEYELANYLKYTNKLSFKIVGYGHSWAGLYIPIDNLGKIGTTIALHHLSGITHFQNKNYCSVSLNDLENVTHVEVMAGTSFAELHKKLDKVGFALSWQSGGIQGLTIGGAISVGFHGSQISSSSISSVVDNLVIYDTYGQKHILYEHNKLMLAARLGLGVCGVITRATLPIEPRFYLRRRRWIEPNMSLFFSEKLSKLKSKYDRFHYYIHPHSNSVWPMFWEDVPQQKCINEAKPCRMAINQWEDELEKDYGSDGLPLIMRWDNCCDISYKAYTHAIDMEAQPLWNGEWFANLSDKEEADTVLEILEIFSSIAYKYELNYKPNIDLWLHIRYMRGDEIYLHPCYGWEQCVGFELALVAKGMHDSLPSAQSWYRYFHPFENYLKSKKAGRPHWAKDHTPDPEYISRSGLAVSSFLEQCKLLNIENIQGYHLELV